MNIYKQIISIFLAVLIPVCLFFCGCSKKTEKVYRVGILSGVDPFANIAEGFKAKMTELGYIEGKNIVYDIKQSISAQAYGFYILLLFSC